MVALACVQSLSDPLFAVPVLGLLLVGAVALAVAGAVHWLYGDEDRDRLERVAYLAGQATLLAFVPLCVSAVFFYAGRFPTAGTPTPLGRIGGLLPWSLLLDASVVVLIGGVAVLTLAVVGMAAREYSVLR